VKIEHESRVNWFALVGRKLSYFVRNTIVLSIYNAASLFHGVESSSRLIAPPGPTKLDKGRSLTITSYNSRIGRRSACNIRIGSINLTRTADGRTQTTIGSPAGGEAFASLAAPSSGQALLSLGNPRHGKYWELRKELSRSVGLLMFGTRTIEHSAQSLVIEFCWTMNRFPDSIG
jgi:hypothetical protein